MRIEDGLTRPRRRRGALLGAAVLALLATLTVASAARATEKVYWVNNLDVSPTVGYANLGESGSGLLSLGKVRLSEPGGMAYDPANGRLYIGGGNEIVWVATDGSGGGVLDTAGATISNPRGIAVDPKTQTVWWVNDAPQGWISYASANGGGGGNLAIPAGYQPVSFPSKVALDTVHGLVYWATDGGGISYAALDGSGGGRLQGPEIQYLSGINVDPASGRLYILGGSPSGNRGLFWVNASGVGWGEVDLGGAKYENPHGLAWDPTDGRFYWGNVGNSLEPGTSIGTTSLVGEGRDLNFASPPANGVSLPVVVKSPSGTAAPQVSRTGGSLSCSQGGWSQDYPGSYVYAAPVSYSYQWLLDGTAITGATGSTLTPAAGGGYSCAITGKNPTGSATQTSATVALAAAQVGATAANKKVTVKAGKAATVNLRFVNRGEVASTPLRICARKLTQKARKGLKAPKCAPLASLPAGASGVAKLRIKTRGSARGTYPLVASVKGASSKPVRISIRVK